MGDSAGFADSGTPESCTSSSMLDVVVDILCMTVAGLSSSTKPSSSASPSAASWSCSATHRSLVSSFSLAAKGSDLLRELKTDAKLVRLENALPETLRRSEPVGKRRRLRLYEDEDCESLLCSSCRRKPGATSEVSEESESTDDRLRIRWCWTVPQDPPLPVDEYDRPMRW